MANMQQNIFSRLSTKFLDFTRINKLQHRGFWSLIYAQSQVAFNDNAYKQILTVLVMALAVDTQKGKQLTALVSFIYILPFLMFSLYSGILAEKFSKRTNTVCIKIFEIIIMTFAIFGFWTTNHYVWMLVLFFLGIHSAFFGPSKYGILPEILPYEKLSWGNGVLELTTFLGIIIGTAVGSFLAGVYSQNISGLTGPMIFFLFLTVTGFLASLLIDKVPSSNPNRKFELNVIKDFVFYWRLIRKDKQLFLAILGFMSFWFLAMIAYLNIVAYTKETLLLPVEYNAWLLVSLVVGIGSGSYLAGILSRGKIELGLVTIGLCLMLVFALLLALPGATLTFSMFCMTVLGFGAGFFIVPTQALIQFLPAQEIKGGIQGVAYWLSNVGTLVATGIYSLLVLCKLSPPMIWVVVSLLVLLILTVTVVKLPHVIFRTIMWFFTSTVYSLNVLGKENIPHHNGALILSNRISFTDALFLAMASPRPIRFIIHEHYCRKWYIRAFSIGMGVIPIKDNAGPRELIATLKVARQAIKNGELVCIIPERSTATISKRNNKGLERIIEGIDGHIVPVFLNNVWGHILKFSHSQLLFKRPLRIPYRITVAFGEHLSQDATYLDVKNAIRDLQNKTVQEIADSSKILPFELIRIAKQAPLRQAIVESNGRCHSYLSTLAQIQHLLAKYRHVWKRQSVIAVDYQNGYATLIAVMSIMMCGRIPLLLSRDKKANARFLRKHNIETVLDDTDEIINYRPNFLHQILTFFTPSKLLFGYPAKGNNLLPALVTFDNNKEHGIIFSHRAITSIVNSFGYLTKPSARERYLSTARCEEPLSFISTVMFPLLKGLTIVFSDKDPDTDQILKICEEHLVTHLVMSADTLTELSKRCPANNLLVLQKVFCLGTLSKPLQSTLRERLCPAIYGLFGIPELGNLISYMPPHKVHDIYDHSDRVYNVGSPFPGTTIKIIHPKNGNILQGGSYGYVHINSPHAFLGYLYEGDLTAHVLNDGWISTNYIGTVDMNENILIDRIATTYR